MAILVCHRGDTGSCGALDLAIRWAECLGSSVLVLVFGSENGDAESAIWDRAATTDISFEIRRFPPESDFATSVLEEARESGVDLIVLEVPAGGGGNPVLGPQISRVILDSPCPVVTTTTTVGAVASSDL